MLAISGVLCLIGFLALGVVRYGPALMALPLGLAVIQVGLMRWFSRAQSWSTLTLLLVGFGSLVAWTVAFSLYLEHFVRSPVFLVGFIAAFVLTCSATWTLPVPFPTAHRSVSLLSNVVALCFICFMSLRTEHLFEVLGEGGAFHHWGAWIGPAELVRQGGWLLWDVPSGYGFLSILTLAALPTATPWQGLYLLGSLSFFLVSSGLFLALRQLHPGPLNYCFALAVAVAAPLFTPAFDPAAPVTARFIFPNDGAYRYIWCFVLVVLLVWEFRTPEHLRRHRLVLIAGCVAWVVGVLWSAESALFCSGVWLPAYAVAAYRSTAGHSSRWLRTAAWLLLPLGLFVATVGLITTVYWLGLGSLPDFIAHVDYVVGLGTVVLVVPVDPMGPVQGFWLGSVALAIAAVYLGTRAGLPTRPFALCWGLFGSFVTTSFIGYTRGVAALHALAYLALAILLVLLARTVPRKTWANVVCASLVPLFAMLLTPSLTAIIVHPTAAAKAVRSLAATARQGMTVEPFIPNADAELQALMAEAGIGRADEVSFLGNWLGNLIPPWTAQGGDGERVVTTQGWLPGQPYGPLRYLPEGRGQRYVQRFVERSQRSGWLVQHKRGEYAYEADLPEFVSGREPWLVTELLRAHVPTRIYESANWQLVWFEYVGAQSAIARPELPWAYVPNLPGDVSLKGRPLAGTRNPELWAVFGTGWGLRQPHASGRQLYSGSVLFIYSPTQQELEFRLLPASLRGKRSLRLVANGDAARGQPLVTGEWTALPLNLQPGWNRITLTVEDVRPASGRLNEEERAARRRARQEVRRAIQAAQGAASDAGTEPVGEPGEPDELVGADVLVAQIDLVQTSDR